MRAKRFVQALVVAATLLVGIVVVGIAATQTMWFKNWLRGYIAREAHQYLNGELSIGRLGGNLFFGIELEDVGIALNGRTVMSVKDIGLRYDSLEFLRKGLSIQSIRIDHPVVYLRRDGEAWSISRLVKKDEGEADRSGPGRPFAIDGIEVSAGSVVFEQALATNGVVLPTRLDDIDARLAFKYEPVHYSVEIAHISLRGTNPAIAVNEVSGGVSVRDDEIHVRQLVLRTGESSITIDGAVRDYLTTPSFNVQAAADPLSLPELGRIVPSLAGVGLRPAIELKAAGPLNQLNAALHVRSSAGELSGQVVADLAAPEQSIRGTVNVRHLDVASISGRSGDKSDVTGVVQADVHASSFSDIDSLRGTMRVQAPRNTAFGYTVERVNARTTFNGRHVRVDGAAGAYGAAATFTGSVTLPTEKQAIVFDLSGDLRRVNLAMLPRQLQLPAAETDFNGSYHASGSAASLQGAVRLADSEIPGAHVARDSAVTFSVKSNGATTPQVDYQADLTAANADLQQIGRAFAIKSLDDDRYRTMLNIRVQGSGHGTSPASMEAAVRGDLTDSSLLGARVPALMFDAMLEHDTLHVKATGDVADVDPSVASGRPQIKGTLAASIGVDATVTNLSAGVDLHSIEASATVSLSPSEVNGLRLDRGQLDARYQGQTLDLRTLDVSGPDLMLHGTGTIGLDPDAASDLKVHAESSNLSELGKLVNQELTGIGAVDAAITGNRTNLKVSGTLTGGGISSGGNGALTLASDYSVDVPNFSAQEASVSATTTATFVTVGGQHINELTAKTRYQHSQLDMDVSARQEQRSMSAAGTVQLRPDERELRLTRLDLTEQTLQWHLAPDSEATIRYGNGVTTVKDLRLASGEQQIAAEGTFGKSDGAEPLNISVKNLDLSNVDALLLRPPQFSGLLNASGAISGSVDAPQVKAQFEVNQGGFRGFHYETFQGTAAFNGKGITVDSQLKQNPTVWVRASGYVPATAFRAPTVNQAGSSEAGSGGEEFDLRIESTPIDLGVVQGFTTALENVTGTAQADIRVTGSGNDPRPKGAIVVTNGAFKVNATGVGYTGLNGRIELQDDRLHIATLDILDNASASLSLTGDLPIREALTGAVSLQMTARDFKVLDNKMGKVRINSDLRVAGELRAPRIEGDLALSTGTINLDPLLASAGDNAYPTKPIEYLTPTSRSSNPAASPESQAPEPQAPEPQAPEPQAPEPQAPEPQAPEPQAPAPQAPGFASVAMNVHLTVPDDLVVKSDDLQTSSSPIGLGAVNVTLGGDLRATKASNQTLRLTGTVNAVRGSYQFQGRQFTILRDGLVRFDGDPIDQLNPTLDVKTQRIILGVQANADIRGTLQRPRIQLTSVPPLERADILSLIVFNQPVNQLGEGQQISLNQRAEQLALGSIAGELSKSLGSLLNVSEFQIQAAPDTGAAAQLTVGQQVGQNLFVRVEQGVGDVSTTNAVVEYELKSWVRLQTNLIQAAAVQQALFQAIQDSGFDLIFTFTR